MTQRTLTEEEFYGLYTRKEIKDSRYYDRQKSAHHVTENMRIDKELFDGLDWSGEDARD